MTDLHINQDLQHICYNLVHYVFQLVWFAYRSVTKLLYIPCYGCAIQTNSVPSGANKMAQHILLFKKLMCYCNSSAHDILILFHVKVTDIILWV